MENTITTQRLADELARSEGYFCATYLGILPEYKNNKMLPVYKACSKDSIADIAAAPKLILGKQSEAIKVDESETQYILHKLTFPNTHARGKCLYGKLDFIGTQTVNVSERKYAQKLLDATMPQDTEGQVALKTAYEYLENAERFWAKVVVKESEDSEGKTFRYLSFV